MPNIIIVRTCYELDICALTQFDGSFSRGRCCRSLRQSSRRKKYASVAAHGHDRGQLLGGEVEELRRAMGFKRSEKRMQEVEAKLRAEMTENHIAPSVQERIIQSITSVVKDAQRHGQRFSPVDVLHSDFLCTIETNHQQKIVRLGLNYVRRLRRETALAIVAARQQQLFTSIEDLQRRVSQLNKKEVAALASLGALNSLPRNENNRHRRGALWEASAPVRGVGPLLENIAVENGPSPLVPWTESERTVADFQNSGLTIGKHPMAFHRYTLCSLGILDAETAKAQPHGRTVQVAGCVICRQRPGTAKGFVFLSLEDETGIMNVIINPNLFDRKRAECSGAPYLRVKGVQQNTWTVVSVKAVDAEALHFGPQTIASHDFY